MKYTNDMKKFIKENVYGISNKELTKKFNEKFKTDITVEQIKSFKRNNKLKSGLDGRFKKGTVPHNKGKKGIKYPGCEKGWFKKGNIPKNHRPVGSERLSKDGYIEIKVSEPGTWRLKHNVVWENSNGKIPANSVVVFLDGNKSNVDINNLRLISRRELLIMNRYGLFTKDDAELSETGLILATMKSASDKAKSKI